MPDFNLLDVLLSEGSAAGAARRLRLSPSAMSRALSRLQEVTGDGRTALSPYPAGPLWKRLGSKFYMPCNYLS